MQLRSDVQLRSMIKSLQDVVLPALDPGNKPAQEQGQLVLAMLRMMRRQLPLQYRFDRDELARLLDFVRRLQPLLGDGIETSLDEGVAVAVRVLDDARRVDPEQVHASVGALRAASAAALQAAFAGADGSRRRQLRDWVLALSGEQLLRDRAWVIDQGWEPDPGSVTPIDSLLGLSHDLPDAGPDRTTVR